MASPQLENGYVRIADELLEGICRYRSSGARKDLILAVIRATYGFQRKSREIGTAYLAKLTGRHPTKVAADVATLIERRVLVEVKRYGFNRCRTLALNKNFEEWVSMKTLTGGCQRKHRQGINENVELPVNENVDQIKTKKDSTARGGKGNSSSLNDKKKRQGTSAVVQFERWWVEQYRQRFGGSYLLSYAKERSLIKRMLDACGGNLETLKTKAAAFLSQNDEFLQRAGHTIGVFKTRFNSLKADGRPKVPGGTGQPEPTFAQRYFAQEGKEV